jgi:GNAT superfamily N-acetyltransferase
VLAERDGFVVSSDPARLEPEAVERLLRSSYWAATRPRDVTERSLRSSLCFGLYEPREGRLVGLARVVTDYVTFAWLCDVILERAYRGRGLGTWLLETVLSAPSVSGVSRWILATRDAHEVYARHGFEPLAHPDNWMERRK